MFVERGGYIKTLQNIYIYNIYNYIYNYIYIYIIYNYIYIYLCVLYEYGSQLTIVVDSTLWTPVGFAVRLDMVAVVAIMTVERRMF